MINDTIANKIKSYLIVILALGIIGVTVYYSIKTKKLQNTISTLHNKKLIDSTLLYVDKTGHNVAVKGASLATTLPPDKQKEVDSLLNIIANNAIINDNLKKKNLVSYANVKTTGDYSSAQPVKKVNKDTTIHFAYQDNYLDYDFSLNIDSLSLKNNFLRTRDSIDIFSTQEKIGKTYFNNIYIRNRSPYNKVFQVDAYQYKLPAEYSRWSIDGQLGAGIPLNASNWNLKAIQPYVGIGIGFQIIRFKKKR